MLSKSSRWPAWEDRQTDRQRERKKERGKLKKLFNQTEEGGQKFDEWAAKKEKIKTDRQTNRQAGWLFSSFFPKMRVRSTMDVRGQCSDQLTILTQRRLFESGFGLEFVEKIVSLGLNKGEQLVEGGVDLLDQVGLLVGQDVGEGVDILDRSLQLRDLKRARQKAITTTVQKQLFITYSRVCTILR